MAGRITLEPMNPIVADGRQRLEREAQYLEQVERIYANHNWKAQRGMQWLVVWWKIQLELRRIRPSDQSLW